jgi:hypothetical protein
MARKAGQLISRGRADIDENAIARWWSRKTQCRVFAIYGRLQAGRRGLESHLSLHLFSSYKELFPPPKPDDEVRPTVQPIQFTVVKRTTSIRQGWTSRVPPHVLLLFDFSIT